MNHSLSQLAGRNLLLSCLGCSAILLTGCSMFDTSPSVHATSSDPPLASLPAPVSLDGASNTEEDS